MSLLISAGCVQVKLGDELHETYRQSVDLLVGGEVLLIFPEYRADEDAINHNQLRPFQKGFTRLGEFYYERTGQRLDFYPVAVHLKSSQVKIGAPIRFNSMNKPVNERLRIRNLMEDAIREMFDELEVINYNQIALRR